MSSAITIRIMRSRLVIGKGIAGRLKAEGLQTGKDLAQERFMGKR